MNSSPNASPALSPRKTRIIVFIGGYVERHGWAPTYDEIRVGVGLRSKSVISYQLDALEARGYVTRGNRAAVRAIALTDTGWQLCRDVAASVSRHPAARRTA